MERDRKNFLDYLKTVKSALAGNGLEKYSIIHLIVGNEACDLDSAVCALVYAFHLTQSLTSATTSGNDTLILPVLNIPEDDYSLKTEVVHVLQSEAVEQEDLIFVDQLDVQGLSQHRRQRLRITLVDHHVPVGGFTGLDSFVQEIIDHHAIVPGKDTDFLKKVDHTIEPVGSCATLIGAKLLQHGTSSVNGVLINLLRQTILLDTVNFSATARKATPKDHVVITELETRTDCCGQSREQVFSELIHAKSDISRLSTAQLLKKDVKVLRLGGVQVAVSSIPLLVKDYFCSQQGQQELADRCQSESIDAAVVLGVSLTGDVSRDLLIFSCNQSCLEKITDGLQTCTTPCLCLESSSSFQPLTTQYRYFHQATTSASRKQILPVLAETLQATDLPSICLAPLARKPSSSSSDIPETATPPNSYINGHGFLTDQHAVFTNVQRRIQQLPGSSAAYASQCSSDYTTTTPSNTYVDESGRTLMRDDASLRLGDSDAEELHDRMQQLKRHQDEDDLESPYGELEDGCRDIFDMEDDEGLSPPVGK